MATIRQLESLPVADDISTYRQPSKVRLLSDYGC